MMLVETYLAPSQIHGIGMFTKHAILQGTKVWMFVRGFDRTFTEQEFARLPELAQRFIERHGFKEFNGPWVISGDEDQFVNHSPTANLVEHVSEFEVTYSLGAARDIAAGEELTQNYVDWDEHVTVKKIGA